MDHHLLTKLLEAPVGKSDKLGGTRSDPVWLICFMDNAFFIV